MNLDEGEPVHRALKMHPPPLKKYKGEQANTYTHTTPNRQELFQSL